jgi:hypothetical protein
MINKVALRALRYCHGGVVGEVLFDMPKEGGDDITRTEMRNIRRAARSLRKKTPEEVEEIAGKGMTAGQVKRRIGIGTGLIMGAGLARRAIKSPELFRQGVQGLKQMAAPRELAGDVVTGATFYGLAPNVIRRSDVEAAKKGKY